VIRLYYKRAYLIVRNVSSGDGVVSSHYACMSQLKRWREKNSKKIKIVVKNNRACDQIHFMTSAKLKTLPFIG
jgi:hypothetical protein